MAGRKIRCAEEARACLDEAARHDVPRAVWARTHGIDARSLNAWRLNLERRARRVAEPAELRLVELVPEVERVQPYVVTCGPFSVEVPHAFDEAVLARLLGVVASC